MINNFLKIAYHLHITWLLFRGNNFWNLCFQFCKIRWQSNYVMIDFSHTLALEKKKRKKNVWKSYHISSAQFSHSVVSDSSWPHESQHARSPCPSPAPGVQSDSRPLSQCLPSSYLILGRPLLLLPPIPASIKVFSNESTLRMRWPKYRSFSFSIIPSKEIPGLISFRMDWLDLLAVQWTLKSLLQHHSITISVLMSNCHNF